ncbi:helix-turn-helix domain-containing protein [Streptococcus dysgalactiae]|uniref:helix-turn-helix domain-containing protein n=1 Tax=Streptococcus dysgalactiae TaxID=1334 RepID=UPI003D9FE594
MNKIQNRIKELRKQKGLTLNDLSIATGFTTSSISRWEEGRRGFDKEKAILLAKILEVKPSELFISDKNAFQAYWNTEKNITFNRDKYIVSIMRKGKKYSRSFETLEEAIKHRDIVLRNYKDTNIFPHTYLEHVSSKYQELIGRKFQRLTVVDVVGAKKKEGVKRTYTYLLCHCDCGKTCEVEIFNLLKSTILSCGCLALEKSQELGKRFGKDRETREKARTSNILNPNSRKTNKSTGIKNITYSPKLKSYRVQIIRRGVRYMKRFSSLTEAINYKESVLSQLDKAVQPKNK